MELTPQPNSENPEENGITLDEFRQGHRANSMYMETALEWDDPTMSADAAHIMHATSQAYPTLHAQHLAEITRTKLYNQ